MIGEHTLDEVRAYANEHFGNLLTPHQKKLFVVSLSAFIALDLVRGCAYLSVSEAHEAAIRHQADRFAGAGKAGGSSLPEAVPANSLGG